MSDPYSEATRNEHGGNFRLSRTILGGGSLALLLIGLVVWITVVVGRSFDQSPEAAAELNFKLATARAAAAGAVLQAPEPRTGLRVGIARGLADARQLAAATAAVLGSILEDEGFTFTPVDEGSDVSIDVKLQTGERSRSSRMTIVAVADKLDRVARGDARLVNMGPRLADWVPVYPGSQMFVRGAPHPTSSLDFAGFVAKAGADEIVDWYQDVANFIERDATDPALQAERRVTTVRMGPDGRVRESFAMAWGDRLVSLVVTEDEFGDSLFVLIFRG